MQDEAESLPDCSYLNREIDAYNGVWFSDERMHAMSDEDKQYFSDCTIMYQTGKASIIWFQSWFP